MPATGAFKSILFRIVGDNPVGTGGDHPTIRANMIQDEVKAEPDSLCVAGLNKILKLFKGASVIGGIPIP
jgi:hypothetical protein